MGNRATGKRNWLKQKNSFKRHLNPKIAFARRQCLAYYQEELKLRIFQEKEADLYNEAVAKYGPSAETDSEVAKEMLPAARRQTESANEILRHRGKMASVPDTASATYYAWQVAYSDYLSWATAQAAALSAVANGMASYPEQVHRLFSRSEKSRRKAEAEEKRFLKRLRLTSDESRKTLIKASMALGDEDWQPEEQPMKSRAKYQGVSPSLEELGRKHEALSEEKVGRRSRRLNTAGCLAPIVILLVLLVAAEVGVATYGYSQLQTTLQIQQCSPEIDVAAKSGVSAVNRITGLNLEVVQVFTNASFVPLYVPPMNHEVAVEGKRCRSIIQTRAVAIAPSGRVSQSIDLHIGSHELPEVALHPLANGGMIDVTIVSKIPLGDYSLARTTQVETSITKPLSSYIR
jgi:hypothetical protein